MKNSESQSYTQKAKKILLPAVMSGIVSLTACKASGDITTALQESVLAKIEATQNQKKDEIEKEANTELETAKKAIEAKKNAKLSKVNEETREQTDEVAKKAAEFKADMEKRFTPTEDKKVSTELKETEFNLDRSIVDGTELLINKNDINLHTKGVLRVATGVYTQDGKSLHALKVTVDTKSITEKVIDIKVTDSKGKEINIKAAVDENGTVTLTFDPIVSGGSYAVEMHGILSIKKLAIADATKAK